MIYEAKYCVLDDTSLTVNDIIDNIVYIRLCYSVENALCNTGLLTLVSPVYVKNMSSLLKLIHGTLERDMDDNSTTVPDKTDIIK